MSKIPRPDFYASFKSSIWHKLPEHIQFHGRLLLKRHKNFIHLPGSDLVAYSFFWGKDLAAKGHVWNCVDGWNGTPVLKVRSGIEISVKVKDAPAPARRRLKKGQPKRPRSNVAQDPNPVPVDPTRKAPRMLITDDARDFNKRWAKHGKSPVLHHEY